MKTFLRDNGLLIAMFGLFLLFASGLTVVGFFDHNQQQVLHHQGAIGFGEYLRNPDLYEALFENWESEFLEMALYVILTAFLCAKGSAESKPPEEMGKDPRPFWHPEVLERRSKSRHGLVRWLYAHSLGLTLGAFFATSFVLHMVFGAHAYDAELHDHGHAAVGVWSYVTGPRFWYQALQNWQSEFLGVGTLLLLSIFLREKGSPQSKPTDAPNAATGEEAKG